MNSSENSLETSKTPFMLDKARKPLLPSWEQEKKHLFLKKNVWIFFFWKMSHNAEKVKKKETFEIY